MIEQIRDICAGCDLLMVIQNKKYWLCSECMFKKRHEGKGRQEVYKERHDKKENKKHPPQKPNKTNDSNLVEKLKKTFSIKKISNKRANVEKELTKVYGKIDREREMICEGCGKNSILSHSHLLSRYNRPDLICDEENIRLHCMGDYNSCHSKWERFVCVEVKEMLDFKENLEYIKEKDPKVYNKIIAKFAFEGIEI